MDLYQIMAHQFTYDPRKSIYGILLEIFNNSGNLVKFDYEGQAMAPMSALFRMEIGATVDDKAVGHIHHKGDEPLAFVSLGTRKDNLNVTLLRSMKTRKADGSYDTRAYTIASPINGQKVTEIHVCRPFKSWETISLRDLPVWPQIISDEDRAVLVAALQLRAELELQKESCDKIKDSLRDKFTRERKKNTNLICLGPDGTVYYKPPSGSNPCIQDEHGERVSKIPFAVKNGLKLIPQGVTLSDPYTKPDLKDFVKWLPYFYRESSRIKAALKRLNNHIRPFELGMAEVSLPQRGTVVKVAGVDLLVSVYDVKEFDYPPETASKIDSGLWVTGALPKTKGRNIFQSSGQTQEEAEAEADAEEREESPSFV